jgi:hypothetical protein
MKILTIRDVVPAPDGSWRVIAPGTTKASGCFLTQREAEIRAWEIVRNAGGGTIRIHDLDGRVREDAVQRPAVVTSRGRKTFLQPRTGVVPRTRVM